MNFKKISELPKTIGSKIPDWALPFLARISIFFVFWKSVQTKIDGGEFLGQNLAFWSVTDTTFTLFEYEYELPLIPYNLAAYLATFTEFFFALGLLFGLFTRLSALGLVFVTLVIQIFVVPESWDVHLLWAALLIYLVKQGAGKVSVDHVIESYKK